MRFAAVIALAGAFAISGLAIAGSATAGEHRKSYKAGPKVKGYSARGGGYSYSYSDTINTYGDSRNLYGSTQNFRDPMLDRQTNAGPFDHGFFFESGTAARGGNSPYMN